MTFSTDKTGLVEALKIVSQVINGKTTLPILENVLINAQEAENSIITLFAKDLETTISCRITATIEQEGQITIPSKAFQKILKSLPKSRVEIETDNNGIKLTCGSTNYLIPAISAQEFPELPEVKPECQFEIDVQCLRRMASSTSLFCAQDDIRASLDGIQFEIHAPTDITANLTITATDAIRLLSQSHPLAVQPIIHDYKEQPSYQMQAGEIRQYLIPGSAIEKIGMLLSEKDEGNIDVSFDKHYAKFVMGQITLITKLQSDKYPEWRSLIPKELSESLTVNRIKLREALKRLHVVACDGNMQVVFCPSTKDKTCHIVAWSPYLGTATHNVPINSEKTLRQFGANVNYLLDITNAFHGKELIFNFSPPYFDSETIVRNAMLITSSDPADKGMITLLMPMVGFWDDESQKPHYKP